MDNDASEAISQQQDCFLCNPSQGLVFFERGAFVALAGLGPVVDGYSLIATKAHTQSMADISAELTTERDTFVRTVRTRLTSKYERCLITEHGRMGVCVDDVGSHDAHCLHAHFLLFPGANDISGLAQSYFADLEKFDDLSDALSHARSKCDEYVLISPTPQQFNIFSKPLSAPRQLARYLVAHNSEAIHLADWRSYPNLEQASGIATNLRPLFDTVSANHA